ncbi:MAG: phosphatidate cytidylyltransferase [Anaerolineae bacterium]|nr:phosphatidate cytidylyltransferase [Anaerolineae bacterium]
MASLKVRFISAIILIPIVIIATLSGGWLYALLIGCVTLICCFEYVRMLERKGYRPSLLFVSIINVLWLADAFDLWGSWTLPVLAVVYFATVVWALYDYNRYPADGKTTANWALTIAGSIYIGISGSFCLRLRIFPDGLWWTLLALPTVWIGDTFAYFIGSRWGKHKMFPAISPAKSWEGYISEVISTLLVGAGFGTLWPLLANSPTNLTPLKGMALGGALGLLTPVGDFFISMIKREAGVKDSGNLIPGHGGMLDRTDSLFWAVFLAWIFARL